jgi:alkyldihydroxyacetonephosphate synthase
MCWAGAVDRLSHARGKAFRVVVRNLHGDLTHIPDLVARPGSEQDVIDLLDWCDTAEIAVIPYGGGSSVVGGVEPRFDGPAVTLDLQHLDQVVEIDATHARDLVGAIPGATHLHRPTAVHMLLQDAPHCVSTAIGRAMGTVDPPTRRMLGRRATVPPPRNSLLP